jgi:hypothetical protein
MNFEWDPKKANANLQKHGVSFEMAASAFLDDYSATFLGPDHGRGEHRLITFGIAADGILVVVAHTERGENIRIISARYATRKERKKYESQT